jgi:hypothetical protein
MVGMFVGVHTALAMRTGNPELMVEPEEAKAFMKAAQNVMRHYDVKTTQKTLDWIAFAGCCGSIYGTRAFAIAARKAGERQSVERPPATAEILLWPKRKREPEEAPQGLQAEGSFVPSVPPGDAGAEHFGGFDGYN